MYYLISIFCSSNRMRNAMSEPNRPPAKGRTSLNEVFDGDVIHETDELITSSATSKVASDEKLEFASSKRDSISRPAPVGADLSNVLPRESFEDITIKKSSSDTNMANVTSTFSMRRAFAQKELKKNLKSISGTYVSPVSGCVGKKHSVGYVELVLGCMS